MLLNSKTDVANMERVSLTSSGMQWDCPNCEHLNQCEQITDVVECGECHNIYATQQEPRSVYFIMETERDNDGNFVPCIAKESESGFWRTNWQWGKDKKLAQECADDMNEKLGITKKDAMMIQLRSMRAR